MLRNSLVPTALLLVTLLLVALTMLAPAAQQAHAAEVSLPDLSAKASTQAIHPSAIYRWDNVLDGDPATCWGVYRSQAVGQWIETELGRLVGVRRLGISTGCSGRRSSDLCARPKKVLVHAGGQSFSALLKDDPQPQFVDLNVETDTVRVEILDVYPLNGSADSPLVCVSDLEFVLDGGVRYVYRAAPGPSGPNEVRLDSGMVLTASSRLFSAAGAGYGPDMLVDGNPATPWAEGKEDEGAGSWATITFPATATLDSLTVYNGFQERRAFLKHNRVKVLELEFSDGTTRRETLADTRKPQVIELGGQETRFVRLTVREVYWANPVRHHGDTGIGEVVFGFAPGGDPLEKYAKQLAAEEAETAADGGAEGERGSARGGATAQGPTNDEPQPGSAATQDRAAAPLTPQGTTTQSGDSGEMPQTAAVSDKKQSARPEAEHNVQAEQETQERSAGRQPVDTRTAAFLKPVREYYRKLLTLDETFPELFSSLNYDRELFTFEHFKAIQRQLGTEQKLKNAVVDLSGLRFRPRSLTRDRARVAVQGVYSVYAGSAFVEQPEDSIFTLVWEKNHWKIEDKEDFIE